MKLAKLSLAAIMTVGALSTANAQPLEEAIKNVDFTGMVRYRLNDTNRDAVESDTAAASTAFNDFDVLGKVTAPVTDNIKFVGAFATNGSYNDNHAAGPDANNLDLRKMFFVYTQDAVTVKAGLQPISTLLTDGGFNGDKGNGVVAMYNLDSVTLASMYFGNSNNLAAEEIMGLAAMGSFGAVNAQAWYVTTEQTIDSSLGLQLDGKFAGVSLMGQVFQTTLQDIAAPAEDKGLWFGVKAGYAMDNFSVNAGYTKNDDDQGTHTLTVDAGNLVTPGWQMVNYTENVASAEAMFIDAGVTFGKIGTKIGYATAEFKTANTDVSEIYGMVSYKVAKNLNTYAKYSDVSNDDVTTADEQNFRFEAKYSF
jgi:hypothetical protein